MDKFLYPKKNAILKKCRCVSVDMRYFVSWDEACLVQDTKSLMSVRFLVFPSTGGGTCFSHDKNEKCSRFTIRLAS